MPIRSGTREGSGGSPIRHAPEPPNHVDQSIRHAADLVTKEEFRVLRKAAEDRAYHGPPVLLEVRAKR